MKTTTVKAEENIFEVLGLNSDEAANLLVRAKLMQELTQYIQEEEMTQRAAGKFFGTPHSRINDLLKGHIEKFTIDFLVNMAAKAGKKITIHLEDLPKAA